MCSKKEKNVNKEKYEGNAKRKKIVIYDKGNLKKFRNRKKWREKTKTNEKK